MTDTLAEKLRQITADDNDEADILFEAADRLEQLEIDVAKLESIVKEDNSMLRTYHKWCDMNGCAPSSSDLMKARAALGEKKDGD